jgi:cyclic lactone autoinducer peptide
MKKLKAFLTACCIALTTVALTLGAASAGAFCIAFFHQPKIPPGMSKFRKQKSNPSKTVED